MNAVQMERVSDRDKGRQKTWGHVNYMPEVRQLGANSRNLEVELPGSRQE